MMRSYKTPIQLDDVEDTLTALGVTTIGLSKVKGTKREYFVECVNFSEFITAIAWCDEVKSRFNRFKIHPFMRTEMNLRYDA